MISWFSRYPLQEGLLLRPFEAGIISNFRGHDHVKGALKSSNQLHRLVGSADLSRSQSLFGPFEQGSQWRKGAVLIEQNLPRIAHLSKISATWFRFRSFFHRFHHVPSVFPTATCQLWKRRISPKAEEHEPSPAAIWRAKAIHVQRLDDSEEPGQWSYQGRKMWNIVELTPWKFMDIDYMMFKYFLFLYNIYIYTLIIYIYCLLFSFLCWTDLGVMESPCFFGGWEADGGRRPRTMPMPWKRTARHWKISSPLGATMLGPIERPSWSRMRNRLLTMKKHGPCWASHAATWKDLKMPPRWDLVEKAALYG